MQLMRTEYETRAAQMQKYFSVMQHQMLSQMQAMLGLAQRQQDNNESSLACSQLASGTQAASYAAPVSSSSQPQMHLNNPPQHLQPLQPQYVAGGHQRGGQHFEHNGHHGAMQFEEAYGQGGGQGDEQNGRQPYFEPSMPPPSLKP